MTQPLSTTTPITLGVPVMLTPPASSLNIGAVVIANHSSYLVSVVVNASIFNLSPYSKDRFDMGAGSSPVQINTTNPENAPSSLPAYLIAEWFSNGEEPARASYPVALTASPYAIAAQVAAAQLAQGVPNVLTSSQIIAGQNLAAGASLSVDVSGYAAIEVLAQIFPGQQAPWYDYTFSNTFPGNVVIQTDSDTVNTRIARLAVTGAQFNMTNRSASSTQVWIVGTNRVAQDRSDARAGSRLVISTSANIPASATATGLAFNDTDVILEGLVYIHALASPGTVKGYFTVTDARGNSQIIMDTGDFLTTGALYGGSKLCCVPPTGAGAGALSFTQTTAIAGNVRLRMTAANPG